VNLENFSSLIMTGKSVMVEKTPERVDHLAHMCHKIWSESPKRRNRTPKQIFDDCLNAVIEQALPVIDPRFKLNPKEFDHKDPDSYNYDVRFDDAGSTYRFEIKRMRQAASKWHTYSVKNLKTYFRNFRNVDYVLSGKIFTHPDHWEVGFHLLAKATSYLPDDDMLSYMHDQMMDFDGLVIAQIANVPDRDRCLKQTTFTSPDRPWTYYNVYYDKRKAKNRCVSLDDDVVQYTLQLEGR
jgi:hypothetical protein